MKPNPTAMTMLYDFYGETLSEKQKDFFDLYYNGDLSLGEIAENSGITRQGVRDVILRATETLERMEEKLGLVALHGVLQKQVKEIRQKALDIEGTNAKGYGNPSIREDAQKIVSLTEELLAKI